MFMIVSGIVVGFSAYFLTQVVYAMGISNSLPVGLEFNGTYRIIGADEVGTGVQDGRTFILAIWTCGNR